jgi:hypothetical protein
MVVDMGAEPLSESDLSFNVVPTPVGASLDSVLSNVIWTIKQ